MLFVARVGINPNKMEYCRSKQRLAYTTSQPLVVVHMNKCRHGQLFEAGPRSKNTNGSSKPTRSWSP